MAGAESQFLTLGMMARLVGKFRGSWPRLTHRPGLIIHAGLHKSGTTSVQSFLKCHFADAPPAGSEQREQTRLRGRTVYPIDDRLSEASDPGHNRLAQSFWEPDCRQAAEHAASVLQQVINERHTAEKIVISAEDIAFAPGDSLREFAQGLKPWSPRLVLSVSPHAAVYKGLFSTSVQWGFVGSIQDYQPRAKRHPALDPQVFQKFADAFRNSPIDVVVSLRSESPECFLKRFCNALEVPWPDAADEELHVSRNSSLGTSEIEVMRSVNERFTRYHHLDQNRASKNWERYVLLRQRVVELFGSDVWRESFPREPSEIDGEAGAFLRENVEEFIASIRVLERGGRIRVHGDLAQLNQGLA